MEVELTMKILDIIPKDISIITEFSIQNIEALLFCMEKCQLTYDLQDEDQVDKVAYFTHEFHQTLCDLEEKLKDAS